ncbi:hypothetical protein QQS21_011077 [Conoideocrella luteorostrata]|uniref:Uncharacterized protein n=1 Tax=Conoideocrella luteorostrata TaxID=1105319 RepID=A0AAJ0CE34_9HYPO|nr:hypothetical protein QQS21_011077 [Conoideocrella luteorostrata]
MARFRLVALGQALEWAKFRDGADACQPLPPSQDPWYKAPDGFEYRQPGEVLRIRQAPGNLTKVIGTAAAAINILYRTTDARKRPSWAVTTLFLPRSFYFSPSGNAALVSYQFAYNSANLDSSPSIGLYWRMAQENEALGLKSSDAVVIELLSRGWVVNAPDYWGPSAAFGASDQGGRATLDSLRAVLNLASFTSTGQFNIGLWAYSGGSIGTMAAAQMQQQYAPELNIGGVALGGLVDNIAANFSLANKSPIAGTIAALLLGLTAQFPDAREYLESRLVPETRARFLSVLDINAADTAVMFAGKDMFAYFKGGEADLQEPILQHLYKTQADVGNRNAPSMPLFLYKAIGDEYCPVTRTDVTVKKFCDTGADITFERNTVGEHVAEIENSKPAALQFLSSVLNESYEWSGCITRNVTRGKPLP